MSSLLRDRLERLECHFTWSLKEDAPALKRQKVYLEERLQSGCAWEGHACNLLGFIHDFDGDSDKALSFFKRAEEILRGQGAEERGAQLLVNQANLAWVHYNLGELPECETYLESVLGLMEEFPAPPCCNLHPEVHGEKGWTQMKLNRDFKCQAIGNFEMAVKGDPGRKEWHTGLALALYKAEFGRADEVRKTEIRQQIIQAKNHDPSNPLLSALYLGSLVGTDQCNDEHRRLAHALLPQFKGDLGGLSNVLYFLRLDDALDAAEEIVQRYPASTFAKKQLAICGKRKLFDSEEMIKSSRGRYLSDLKERTVQLYEEVTRSYKHYVRGKLDIAKIHDLFGNSGKAHDVYLDVLQGAKDCEPRDQQLIYNSFANHLHWSWRSTSEATDYHKKVASIAIHSVERQKSIKILQSVAMRNISNRGEEIQEFLDNLQF